MLALTDHDGVSGLAEARAKAESEGVRFVDGVEVSVTWEGSTVHIVGLQIDPEDPVLLSGLESIRQGRATRAEKMGEALAAAGVPDSLAGAKAYAENPSLISRSHFARHLDRKSTRLNSSHLVISYAVFCLKKKRNNQTRV